MGGLDWPRTYRKLFFHLSREKAAATYVEDKTEELGSVTVPFAIGDRRRGAHDFHHAAIDTWRGFVRSLTLMVRPLAVV